MGYLMIAIPGIVCLTSIIWAVSPGIGEKAEKIVERTCSGILILCFIILGALMVYFLYE